MPFWKNALIEMCQVQAKCELYLHPPPWFPNNHEDEIAQGPEASVGSQPLSVLLVDDLSCQSDGNTTSLFWRERISYAWNAH